MDSEHMATIFLIGPRGSGKSTVGKLLAKRLGLPFLDTDRLVCERAGCGIAELVDREGWPAFRALEASCLAHAAQTAQGSRAGAASAGGEDKPEGAVIATGGGAVLAPENRECMRAVGPVIYLQTPLEVLAKRLERDLSAEHRPSLTGKDPIEELAAVLAEREPLYLATAHHIVAAERPLAEIVEELAAIVVGSGFYQHQHPAG